MNRQLALALEDGMTAGALAEAAQLSRREVLQAGLAFDDLHPQQPQEQEHLTTIRSLGEELAATKAAKAAADAEQLHLLASTRRQGVMDDFELARLTGIRHDHIRRLTWGLGMDGAASKRSGRQQ